MGGLDDFVQLVQNTYANERHRVREQKEDALDNVHKIRSIHKLTEADLQSYIKNESLASETRRIDRPVTLLGLLEGWNELIKIQVEQEVFLNHMKIIKKAFKATTMHLDSLSTQKPQAPKHVETLLQLLIHTAENARRDGSTECRFVTLLEVLLSYTADWEPSDDCQRLWIRLMQRIPYPCADVHFRRKAYRVLVSLSWVPSSLGLLAACSIEERSVSTIALPKASHSYRSAQSPSCSVDEDSAIPRHDSVNQLLDRLKDETDVCVAITSKNPGMGKSTLASLVVSHPSIQKSFYVVWLRLQPDTIDMTYTTYREYVSQLCDQIREQQLRHEDEEEMSIDFPICEQRFEEPAVRKLRERKAMNETKAQVAGKLQALQNPKMLLVLENVTNDVQIGHFRFHEQQSLIITTTDQSLKNVDWQVELDSLNIQESVDLFLGQAGLPLNHPIGRTAELRSMLQNDCQNHALTVRTVARWFRLKSVYVGPLGGLKEVLYEVGELSEQQMNQSVNSSGGDNAIETDKTNQFLFDILSMMMGPSRNDGTDRTSAIFILCLAAMAVVFKGRVPLDMVLMLWDKVLIMESLAASELTAFVGEQESEASKEKRRQFVGMIAEGLVHMGIVEVYQVDKNTWISIHHEVYTEFALAIAQQLDFGESFEYVVQDWHKAFVTSYFERRIQGNIDAGGANSLEYAVGSLPKHIFQANMMKLAETILTDPNFFENRVEVLGWDRAIEMHVKDCMELQSGIDEEEMNSSSSSNVLIVSSVFAKSMSMICSFIDSEDRDDDISTKSSEVNAAKALYRMAFALAEHGYFEEALKQLSSAEEVTPDSGEIQSAIQYATAWVLLVSGESKRAQQKIQSALSQMRDSSDDLVLYAEAQQLQVDIHFERCDYKKALRFAIEIESELVRDKDRYLIELGALLKKRGCLLQAMGKNKEAIDALSKSIEWKEKAEECSYGLASCYSQLGDLYWQARASSAAKENFERAISTLNEAHCDPEHVNYLLVTGKLSFLRHDFEGSIASLKAARKAIVVTPLYLMDQSAYDLRFIAKVFRARGRVVDAAKTLREGLDLTGHRPNSLERAAILHDIGTCMLELHKEEKGLKCLKQAMNIMMTNLGHCSQLLELLHEIGQVHLARGEHDDALKIYDRADNILKADSPDDTDKAADLLFAIGGVKEARGDISGALDAVERGLEILETLNSDHSYNDSRIGKGNFYLGRLLAASNRLLEARDKFEKAISSQVVMRDEKALVESKFELGVVLRKLGDFEASQQELTDIMVAQKDKGESKELAKIKFELANTYSLCSHSEDALSLYEDSLKMLVENDGMYGDICQAIARVKVSGGNGDEALALYRCARDARQDHYGKYHSKTANSLRGIGLSQMLCSRYEEAQKTLMYLLHVCEHNTGEDTNEYVANDHCLAVILLGDCYYHLQQKHDAISQWNKARNICEEAELKDSPIHSMVADMWERRLRERHGFSPELSELLSLPLILFIDD